MSLTDANGHKNLQEVKEVTVSVEGAGTLQGFGSADPATENEYDNPVWKTYDGYLLAVIRSGLEPGTITARFCAEDCETKIVKIEVR